MSGRIIFSDKLGYDGIVVVTFDRFVVVTFDKFVVVTFDRFITATLDVTINVSEAELEPWVATT